MTRWPAGGAAEPDLPLAARAPHGSACRRAAPPVAAPPVAAPPVAAPPVAAPPVAAPPVAAPPSGPARSGPARSGPARSGPARSGPARSGPARSGSGRQERRLFHVELRSRSSSNASSSLTCRASGRRSGAGLGRRHPVQVGRILLLGPAGDQLVGQVRIVFPGQQVLRAGKPLKAFQRKLEPAGGLEQPGIKGQAQGAAAPGVLDPDAEPVVEGSERS